MSACLIFSLLALLAVLPAQGGTLDRIAVTVGRHVISERDILADIRIAAFIDGKPAEINGEQKRKAADRLIDQYLVFEEASSTRTSLPSTGEVAPALASLQARYGSNQAYRAALSQAQIAEEELLQHLRLGFQMLRYTDLRFRPEVQLSEADVHAFYDQLNQQGDHLQSFEASRTDIEKLLTDRQTMQALDRWLGMTRSETTILYRDAVFQ